jgi:hypothetical protein
MAKEVSNVVGGIPFVGPLLSKGVNAISGSDVKGTSPTQNIQPVQAHATETAKKETKDLEQETKRKARQAQTLLTSRSAREASVSTLSQSLSGSRSTLG